MSLQVLHETDTMVWGRESDQVRALGFLLLLSSTTEIMSQEPLMMVLERHQALVARNQYFIIYERKNKDSSVLVPVAFATWAFLSRPAAVVFETRLRPLHFAEMKSGSALWAIDIVAQFGHVREVMEQLRRMFRDEHAELYMTRLRDNVWRKETHLLRKE